MYKFPIFLEINPGEENVLDIKAGRTGATLDLVKTRGHGSTIHEVLVISPNASYRWTGTIAPGWGVRLVLLDGVVYNIKCNGRRV